MTLIYFIDIKPGINVNLEGVLIRMVQWVDQCWDLFIEL